MTDNPVANKKSAAKKVPFMRSCPHCKYKLKAEDYIDAIHPVDREHTIWRAGCLAIAGGCDAEVLGDSEDDAIFNWNKRALDTLLQDAASALSLHMKNCAGTDIPNFESQVHARILKELNEDDNV